MLGRDKLDDQFSFYLPISCPSIQNILFIYPCLYVYLSIYLCICISICVAYCLPVCLFHTFLLPFNSFVRGRSFPSPIILDNVWHHICLSWENVLGKRQFFLDGVLKYVLAGYRIGVTIPGGGLVHVGRKLGGMNGINQNSYIFAGELSHVNMWSSVLHGGEFYLPTYLPTYLPCLPTYLPTYLPIYLSVYLSIYLSTYLPCLPT